MKTENFIEELTKYKEDVENKDHLEKDDILKLLNYYIKLSVLDYEYLKQPLKRRAEGNFVYSLGHRDSHFPNSDRVFEQLYTVSGTYNDVDGMVEYKGDHNLYHAQLVLRDVQKNLEGKDAKFFKETGLNHIFKSLDRLSFSGTAIIGDAFIDYINKDFSVAYDKFYGNDITDNDLDSLKNLKEEISGDERYFFPITNEIIDFENEEGTVAYRFTSDSECNELISLINNIYDKNMGIDKNHDNKTR